MVKPPSLSWIVCFSQEEIHWSRVMRDTCDIRITSSGSWLKWCMSMPNTWFACKKKEGIIPQKKNLKMPLWYYAECFHNITHIRWQQNLNFDKRVTFSVPFLMIKTWLFFFTKLAPMYVAHLVHSKQIPLGRHPEYVSSHIKHLTGKFGFLVHVCANVIWGMGLRLKLT